MKPSLLPISCFLSCQKILLYYSAGKRDRGKRHPQEEGGEAPRLHRTGGEAPCSMKGRKTRREENVFKGVENLPAPYKKKTLGY